MMIRLLLGAAAGAVSAFASVVELIGLPVSVVCTCADAAVGCSIAAPSTIVDALHQSARFVAVRADNPNINLSPQGSAHQRRTHFTRGMRRVLTSRREMIALPQAP